MMRVPQHSARESSRASFSKIQTTKEPSPWDRSTDALRVLILDDDSSYSFLLERMLTTRSPDRVVTCVKSVAEARNAMLLEGHDVYLLDYQLANETCIELLDSMSEHDRSRSIVLTGLSESFISEEVLNSGAADFLLKTEVSLAQLERSMRYTLERSQTLRTLRMRERRLSAILSSSTDTFALFNADASVSYVSPLTLPDSIGSDGIRATGFIHSADHDFVIESVRAIATVADAREEFEIRVRSGDASFIPVRARLHNLLHDVSVNSIVFSCHDISKEKTAAAQLRQAEERFSSAFMKSPIVMTLTTLQEGRFVEVNSGFTKLTGYTREDVSGKTVADIALWESPIDRETLIAALAHGPIVNSEHRFRLKSGEIRECVLSIDKLEYDGEDCLLVLARDITESKNTERQLRSSTAQLSAILENVRDEVWSINPEYKLLSFNRAYAQTLAAEGHDVEIGGYVFYEGLDPIHVDFWLSAYERALNGDQFVIEKQAFFDSSKCFELSFMPIYTDGSISGAAVHRRDISKRKQAQQELTSSKAYLDALLNNTADRIWSVNKDRNLVFLNASLRSTIEAAFGQKIEIGTRPSWLVSEEDENLWNSWFDRAFAGEHVRSEYSINVQGQKLTSDVRFNPVYIADQVEGVAVFSRDITEDKILQSQLIEQRDRAEQMNRLKSSFLANMSHELRTPLTAIIGYASLLSEDLSGTDHSQFATTIERSGRRLLETINGILDLARIESGALEPKFSKVDLTKSVEYITQLLLPIARSKHILLDWQSDLKEPIYAETDAHYLEQILTNVVGNGLKFTKVGGVMIQLSRSAYHVHLRVSDSGIGIGEHFLPHAFDEFKQESNGDARSFEGTGLGLTITKRLIEALGGTIRIAETGSEGTVFEMQIPIMRPNKKILLVEDNEHIMLAMSTFLGMKGYEVREAKTCEEARSAITDPAIAVTITDLNLPDGKGEDLIKLADHPVIAMTGHVDDATRARIKEEGFAAFLAKPASLTEILATLESVMSEPKVTG